MTHGIGDTSSYRVVPKSICQPIRCFPTIFSKKLVEIELEHKHALASTQTTTKQKVQMNWCPLPHPHTFLK